MDYQFGAALENFNENKVDFIKTDLDIAITFAQIAQESTDENKAARNLRKAYDAVLHFLSIATLTPRDQKQIIEKLAWLKSALMALGEQFLH
jgi:hypothetical protein